MAINRKPRPESNFYHLDKHISEDQRLSWAARGLLIYLLGKPDNWRVVLQDLINQTADSRKPTARDGVYTLLQELIQAGYVRRSDQSTKGVAGFMQVDYDVCEGAFPPETTPVLTDLADTLPAYTQNPTLVSTDVLTSTEKLPRKDIPLDTSLRTGKSRKNLITITEWLEQFGEEDEIIPPNHPSRRYAADAGIPSEFIKLGWLAFVDRMELSNKKQRDWPGTFTNYVRNNWLDTWCNDRSTGEYRLTSAGIARQRMLEAQAE